MPRRLSEELTRKEMIDLQLEKAGWYLRDHSKVKTEIPVDGYDAEPWNGVSDYTLYRENGEVLAVVEAKKTTVDVRLAEAQLTYYVTEIEKHQSFRPFGFLANGYQIYFVDVGISGRREVFAFFTRENLENLPYIRQNTCPLSEPEINTRIVDCSYQHEPLRRVRETFAQGKRKALIVMATGQASINQTQLKNLVVPIPALAEQERIVKRVEQLLGWYDALEAQLNSAVEECGRLDESMLARVGGKYGE